MLNWKRNWSQETTKYLLVFLFFLFGNLISEKSISQNASILKSEEKQTKGITIDPEYPMWFIDNGSHPYLTGVSESGSISNFWGDPGEEWNLDGSRKANPITHPTQAAFLWSEYLDTLAAYKISCIRELVIPSTLSAASNYDHHYNPFPFPWLRTDLHRDYIPGFREDQNGSSETPGKTNYNYLHSEATPDFSLPQPDYFLYRVQRFCVEAKKRNIYVILTIFPIKPYFPYEPNNENIKAYIDMLLRYTKDLGNVLYEINWEGGNGDYFTWWAGYIKDKLKAEGRPQNIILVNHSLVKPSVNQSTINSTIIGHHRDHTHKSLLKSRKYNKPVIWTEDFDEGKTNTHNKDNVNLLRHRSWYSFVAGAHHIWYDWSMRFGSYRDPVFIKALASVVTFINTTNIPFWTMSPNDLLVTDPDSYVLANPGKYYVVYFSNGVQENASIKLPPGKYKAKWFNPKTEPTGSFIGEFFNVPTTGKIIPPVESSSKDKFVLYIVSD